MSRTSTYDQLSFEDSIAASRLLRGKGDGRADTMRDGTDREDSFFKTSKSRRFFSGSIGDAATAISYRCY